MEQLRKAIKLAMFDRRTAANIMFDNSATGDAVLIVAGVYLVIDVVAFIRFGSFSLTGLLEDLIFGVARWIILSFAIWLLATRLLKGSGEAQTLIRTAGFAHLPLLLIAVRLGLIGLVWYLAVLVLVTSVVLGLGLKEAAAGVVLGAAAVYLLQIITRAALLPF